MDYQIFRYPQSIEFYEQTVSALTNAVKVLVRAKDKVNAYQHLMLLIMFIAILSAHLRYLCGIFDSYRFY